MYRERMAVCRPLCRRKPLQWNRKGNSLAWPEEFVQHDGGILDEIHAMAETGKSITEPMNTQNRFRGFEEIVLLGAQLDNGAA